MKINTYNKIVEPTPPSFAIRLYSGSLFILFLSINLFAKRGCSPRRCGGKKLINKQIEGKIIPPQWGVELPLKRFVGAKKRPNKSLERKFA